MPENHDSNSVHQDDNDVLANRIDDQQQSGRSIVENSNSNSVLEITQKEVVVLWEDESFLEPDLAIKVLGVGGAGCNVVNYLVGEGLDGVACMVANTDVNSLKSSKAPHRILIGREITKGRSAGGRPNLGREAAEEQIKDLEDWVIKDTNLLFLIAGMGGGTGTGAMPVIAQKANELDILTIGIVLTPFKRDGKKRMKITEKGIEELCQYTDLLVVIANENLHMITHEPKGEGLDDLREEMTQLESYQKVNDYIYQCILGVTKLLTRQGVCDIDFAHLESLIKGKHSLGVIGLGEACGENRASEATRKAIYNPLVEAVTDADEVLVNVFSRGDIKEIELGQVDEVLRSSFNSELEDVQFGSTIEDLPDGWIRVLVIAANVVRPAMRSYIKGNIGTASGGTINTAAHFQKPEVVTTAKTEEEQGEQGNLYDDQYKKDKGEQSKGDEGVSSGLVIKGLPKFLRNIKN